MPTDEIFPDGHNEAAAPNGRGDRTVAFHRDDTPPGGGGGEGDGDDPDTTRDMLWVNLQYQRDFNARILQVIDRQHDAHQDALRKVGDQVESALKEQAKARIVEATKAAESRVQEARENAKAGRYATNVNGALMAVLIVGVLSLAGVTVSGKVFGQTINTQSAASP